MSNIWDRFDSIASPEEVIAAKDRFTPIPAGNYEAVLEKLEATTSKSGFPMLASKFRTLENRVIFGNKMLQSVSKPEYTAGLVADANKFVGDLLGTELEFAGLSKLCSDIESVPMGGTYTVNVSYGKNDLECKFASVKIVKKEPDEEAEPLPFDMN